MRARQLGDCAALCTNARSAPPPSTVPELLPEEEKLRPQWYPTMSMSLQFFCALPVLPPVLAAPRTVGLFSSGQFIREGMHQQHCSVWTAPSAIGEGESIADWRRRSMILCTSTQVASLPQSIPSNSHVDLWPWLLS